MSELPEYIDGVPNISGAEARAAEVMRAGHGRDLYRGPGRIDFGAVRSACAVGLHMHQPLIPAGGGDLRYIPALNARDDHVSFLSRTIEKNIAGWPEANPDWSLSETSQKLEKSLQRARDMGATC